MDKTAARRTKLGPVSRPERASYRARLPNDGDWGRPETATAEKLCEVLGVFCGRSGADQSIAPLNGFGFGLDEIERRDQA